jgi:predicted aldo/keto reductase-like oxidoreductase
MDTVKHLDRANELLPAIHKRLQDELAKKLGDQWAQTWDVGLPDWDETPGEINMRWILRLRNLALAYDMVEYGKMRYNLLGNGGAWFPGQKADKLDTVDLQPVLKHSPHAATIPGALAEAHELLSGEKRKRLQEAS